MMSGNNQKGFSKQATEQNQKGSALVIAVFVLALISVFVALALSRTASEAAAVGNETVEGKTFYAAQGSLEMMTRNFNKVFETKLNPSENDLNKIKTGAEPSILISQFSFDKNLDQITKTEPVTLTDKAFAGLYAIRDGWRLRTTATDKSGIQVRLTRNVLNNQIPIFQFGIFNDDDLELYRPPRFAFGGRVHTNRNFFISPGDDGVYFDSRVTAAGQIITQTWRNGFTGDSGKDKTFIKNASRVDKQLFPANGSVLNTCNGCGDNIFSSDPDMPPSKLNTDFLAQSAIFDGNLVRGVDKLKLPIKVDDKDNDLVELIKRPKPVGDLGKNGAAITATSPDRDTDVMRAERFANKTGIRISLSDSKAKLPGCATVTTACGVMLNGDKDGTGPVPNPTPSALVDRARGYQPKTMKLNSGGGSYIPTRVNGERLYAGRDVWIKVETVQTNSTDGSIVTKDITEDFLSLGVTEQAPDDAIDFEDYDETHPNNCTSATDSNCKLTQTTAQTPSEGTDSRSIIKIQRFAIPGGLIPGANYTGTLSTKPTGTTKYLYPYTTDPTYNYVFRYAGKKSNIAAGCTGSNCKSINETPNSTLEVPAHGELVKISHTVVNDNSICKSNGNGNEACFMVAVPFPIEMFDTREGIFYDSELIFRNNKVTKMGVMSMIDIDVANLRRFLRGDFDGLFPTDTTFAGSNGALKSTSIPSNDGWVLYVSDRRGDKDFDGEFDMEDIYGYAVDTDGRFFGSNLTLDAGEDVNGNGVLEKDFGGEAPDLRYKDDIDPDEAAVTDHEFFRRGVRLINGAILPGIYDAVTSANNKGFTLASENGVYVYGNYNATGITSVPSTGNTPAEDFRPYGRAATATSAAITAPTHIAASIVADAVTILSNSKYFPSGVSLTSSDNGWNDSRSFAYPYDQTKRRANETTIRFAMIAGDTLTSKSGDPNQGGLSPKLNGGVHNFKRYLEQWVDQTTGGTYKARLNYAGSLINLFNSHNNNGSFKCCSTVYDPPVRNWVFDSSFLDPTRLPPGTPFFQYVQITGFERDNN